MFPQGAPGYALLLLRVSVATDVLMRAGTHRGVAMLAITIALGITLCIGFLTPIAALLTIPVYLVDIAILKVAPTAMLVPILHTTGHRPNTSGSRIILDRCTPVRSSRHCDPAQKRSRHKLAPLPYHYR